jgi:hypothetical protein
VLTFALVRRIAPVIVAVMTLGVTAGLAKAASPTWKVQPTPSMNAWSGFNGVACPSGTECLAVGFHNDGNGLGNEPLSGIWNGSTWSIGMPPLPSGSTSGTLYRIGCNSTKSCLAVGDFISSTSVDSPLAEKWNGQSWTSATPLMPTGASDAFLSDIACTKSASVPISCWAVGQSQTMSTHSALAEAWNGKSWTLANVPSPTGATETELNGVFCNSPTLCLAVGVYLPSSGGWEPFSATWNGSTWGSEPMVGPTGVTNVVASGVSCPTTSLCMAVGTIENDGSSNPYSPLIERWNGSNWLIITSPSVPDDGQLASVSCKATSECEAVGQQSVGPLVEGWNGTSWRVQATPAISSAQLQAVRCTGKPYACTAVGSYLNTAVHNLNPLVERYS